MCSSWVTLNRATSGRRAHNPLGYNKPYVRDANVMVSRMSMLIMFGLCLGVEWVLEQPLSSIMVCHPRMRQVQRDICFSLLP